MSLVQHKSTVVNGSRAFAVVNFDVAVTQGNLIVVFGSIDPSSDLNNPSDNQNNSYTLADQRETGSDVSLGVWYAVAKASGMLSIQASGFGDEVSSHVHAYEIAGYNTLDQHASSFQEPATAIAVLTGSTDAAAEIVLAAFSCDGGSPTLSLFGVTGLEQTTGDDGSTVASGATEVTSMGDQSASAISSVSGDLLGLIVTFKFVAPDPPDPPDPSSVFLGSVTEVDSAPVEDSDPFLGTVTVLESVPAGASNPYLGRVRVGTPTGSQTNPSLGKVVVIGSAPSGDSDPYLGTVETS
jgi:hypothetical protein